MSKKKKISYFSANASATVSVALVLLLVGVMALVGISAAGITQRVRESIGFNISMRDDATDEQISLLRQQIDSSSYASGMVYISREEAMAQWKEETGEDLIEVLGFNPLTAEIEVRVKAGYSSLDSLTVIESQLRANPAIEEIKVHRDQVEAINVGLRKVGLLLLVVTVALLIISLALINNTVRATVYSARFLIHTMKLVGASAGFIRRPIVVSNMISGVVAAIIAIVVLVVVVYYAGTDNMVGAELKTLLPIEAQVAVGAALVVAGAVICAVTAFFAANKYIRMDYDKLF